jgi:SEC-C motif-containing protein
MSAPTLCPCGAQLAFDQCCGRFLSGESLPQTAEQLMRSRYSAYSTHNIEYLCQTLWPSYQAGFDPIATARWAADNHWTGLNVIACEKGEKGDRRGTVLFEASFLAAGRLQVHRELSLFRKRRADGIMLKPCLNRECAARASHLCF